MLPKCDKTIKNVSLKMSICTQSWKLTVCYLLLVDRFNCVEILYKCRNRSKNLLSNVSSDHWLQNRCHISEDAVIYFNHFVRCYTVYLHPKPSIQSIRTESNKEREMLKLENRKEEGCHVTFLNQSLWMTDIDVLRKWWELRFGWISSDKCETLGYPSRSEVVEKHPVINRRPHWRARRFIHAV